MAYPTTLSTKGGDSTPSSWCSTSAARLLLVEVSTGFGKNTNVSTRFEKQRFNFSERVATPPPRHFNNVMGFVSSSFNPFCCCLLLMTHLPLLDSSAAIAVTSGSAMVTPHSSTNPPGALPMSVASMSMAARRPDSCS